MSTKESELTKALFVYLSRCIAERDQEALRGMRLSRADIELFAELRVTDMERFAASQPHRHFLQISFHALSMRQTLHDIRAQREASEMQEALIQAGAPRAMMVELYGMNHHEYAAMHAELNGDVIRGRLPQPTEQQTRELWAAWNEAPALDPTSPEFYLKLHETTGVSLRIVWPVVQEWRTRPPSPTRETGPANRAGSAGH